MYVFSEEITTAGQSFTYELSQFPEFSVDSSWNIESVDSILDASNCLSAAVEVIDRKTFRVTPDNADFSAYIMINLFFGNKVRAGSRRRSIELRIDFVSKCIERVLWLTVVGRDSDKLDYYTIQFRDPTAEFYYCLSNDPYYHTPPITANWQKIVGVGSVRVPKEYWLVIYTTKNIKYSKPGIIWGLLDSMGSFDLLIRGDINALLAAGKMLVPGALSNVFYNVGVGTSGNFDLRSTNLTEGCFSYAFCGCGGFYASPVIYGLSAKVVPSHAYYYMFAGGYELSFFGDELGAEVLTGSHNFYGMFARTQWITLWLPRLKPKVLTPYCYAHMFDSCGDDPNIAIEATTYAEGCFQGMFKSNSGRSDDIWWQTAPYSHQEVCMNNYMGGGKYFPDITATEFEPHSFERAFKDCLNLCYIRSISLNIQKAMDYAFAETFSREGITPDPNKYVTLCSIEDFTNTNDEEIELGENAFYHMFDNCRTLKFVKNMSLASRVDASNAYVDWLPSYVDTDITGQRPVYIYNDDLLEYAYPGYTIQQAESLIRQDYHIPLIWDLARDERLEDYALSFADEYPKVIDSSLGVIDVGLIVGDGYRAGRTRDVTITAINDSNTIIFNQNYVLDSSSYKQTPYVVRINPDVVQEDWELTIKAVARFSKPRGEYAYSNEIQKRLAIPVDTSLSFADGYPAAVNNALDKVEVGLIVGDGYNYNPRYINIKCYDIDGNTVFNNDYTLHPYTHYTERNPYTRTIEPDFVLKDYYINVCATYNVGYLTNSVSSDITLTADTSLRWEYFFPRLTDKYSLSSVDLCVYMGDGYGRRPRTLHLILKNQNQTTVYDNTFDVPYGSRNPYTWRVADTGAQPQDSRLYVYLSCKFGTLEPPVSLAVVTLTKSYNLDEIS